MTSFGILPESLERVEFSDSFGVLLNENSFDTLVKDVISTVAVNLRILEPDGYVFSVPEPFGSYQQNLYNQKATPVFRQNCFIFESPKQIRALNHFLKKLSQKRLSRNRSIRI